MTEAPETIWAWKWNTPAVKSHGKPAWSDFEPVFDDWVLRGLPTKKEWLGKKEIYKTAAVEYRRADLPATDEQAFANEKVNALVEALRFYEELLTAFSSATDVNADIADETLDRDGGKVARAALEAMKETDDET